MSFYNSFQIRAIAFDKVADLVEGFESAFRLELLSTVHWIVKNNLLAL